MNKSGKTGVEILDIKFVTGMVSNTGYEILLIHNMFQILIYALAVLFII